MCRNLSKLYDMYLFTKGIRKYALEIHSIIDPEEKYIAKQKILSRENTPNHEAKQISKVIPHEESMVLIIDDRKDAWLNSYNVISVDIYIYIILLLYSVTHSNFSKGKKLTILMT